jgi:hypothetical protein
MNFCASFLLFSSLLKAANAWPNGAGSCSSGEAPLLGSSHLTRATINTGTLEDAGFTVSIDGTTLVSGEGVTKYFDVSQDYPLKIGGGTFKGFLVRLGAPTGSSVSTVDALTIVSGDADVQVASVCTNLEGAGGVTHTSNSDKTGMTSTLNMLEQVEALTLDVTVVVENTGAESSSVPSGVSSYYYSRYLITAGTDPSTVTTMAPATTTAGSSGTTTAPVTSDLFVPASPAMTNPVNSHPVASVAPDSTFNPVGFPSAPTMTPSPSTSLSAPVIPGNTAPVASAPAPRTSSAEPVDLSRGSTPSPISTWNPVQITTSKPVQGSGSAGIRNVIWVGVITWMVSGMIVW